MNHELLEQLKTIAPDYVRAASLLPPSLQLRRFAYYRVPTDDVAQKRGAFKKLKSDFLRHVGIHNAEELRMMGLNDHAIARMRDDGRMPANHPGEQLDCSVDHIVSLQFGGLNVIDNLMLVPGRINTLKNELERLQTAPGHVAQAAHVITIVPAHAELRVPYVPGGFQKAQRPETPKLPSIAS